MKEIMAIIRMNMMSKTKNALADAGISSMTASGVLGRGKGLVDFQVLKGAENGYEEAISLLGQSGRLIPKRAILMVVPDDLTDRVVKTVIRVNKTGKSGDGMIFVMPSIDAVSVRTGENGEAVLDEI